MAKIIFGQLQQLYLHYQAIKDASDMLPSLGSKNNSLEDDLKSRLVKFHQNLLNFFDYLKILAALLDPSFDKKKIQ